MPSSLVALQFLCALSDGLSQLEQTKGVLVVCALVDASPFAHIRCSAAQVLSGAALVHRRVFAYAGTYLLLDFLSESLSVFEQEQHLHSAALVGQSFRLVVRSLAVACWFGLGKSKSLSAVGRASARALKEQAVHSIPPQAK